MTKVKTPQNRKIIGPTLAILLSGLMIAVGCQTPNRMTHLKDSLNAFSRQIKWGQLPRAAAFVESKKRAAWLEERLGAMQSVKMIDVQVSRVSSKGPRATTAKVLLSLTWHGRDMVQKRSIWEQTWEHKKKRGWRLISEEPAVLKPKVPVKRSAWP